MLVSASNLSGRMHWRYTQYTCNTVCPTLLNYDATASISMRKDFNAKKEKRTDMPIDLYTKCRCCKILGIICKSKRKFFLKQKIIHWRASLSVIWSHYFGQTLYYYYYYSFRPYKPNKDNERFWMLLSSS